MIEGLLEVIIGVAIGIVFGLFLWYFPSKKIVSNYAYKLHHIFVYFKLENGNIIDDGCNIKHRSLFSQINFFASLFI